MKSYDISVYTILKTYFPQKKKTKRQELVVPWKWWWRLKNAENGE